MIIVIGAMAKDVPVVNNFLSHFYPFLRRAGYLLIAGASLLIGIFFIYRSFHIRFLFQNFSTGSKRK